MLFASFFVSSSLFLFLYLYLPIPVSPLVPLFLKFSHSITNHFLLKINQIVDTSSVLYDLLFYEEKKHTKLSQRKKKSRILWAVFFPTKTLYPSWFYLSTFSLFLYKWTCFCLCFVFVDVERSVIYAANGSNSHFKSLCSTYGLYSNHNNNITHKVKKDTDFLDYFSLEPIQRSLFLAYQH